MDLAALRAKLASHTGKRYWRSLEEVADTPAFQQTLKREFPSEASVFTDPVGRRRFLQLMGASLALAGVTGCTRQPKEYIAPYAAQPPERIPGIPTRYATAMPFGGVGEPLLVESNEGRPTKVEGNPRHPASMGASSIFAQASILTMYDPDRSRSVINRGRASGWKTFQTEMRRQMSLREVERGAGLRILSESTTSPTMAVWMGKLKAALPEAKWHQWEPVGRDGARAGLQAAFGGPTTLRYDLSKAKVILSLDADFLSTNGAGSVRMIRDFAAGRKLEEGGKAGGMNRLYVVEPGTTTTGSNADHRLRLKASAVPAFAAALAAQLGVDGGESVELPEKAKAWIEPLAKDLESAGAAAAVIAGDQQPAYVHAVAAAINARLGSLGSTVVPIDGLEVEPVDHLASLRELVEAMDGDAVSTLVILGSNPVLTAPADLQFAEAMGKVDFRVHLGLHDDETAELCHWHLPQSYYLESWGDVRSADGGTIIQQPLIEPLYDSKSELEMVAMMLGDERTAYDLVRETTMARWGSSGEAFEKVWRKALHDGMTTDPLPAPKATGVVAGWASAAPRSATSEGLELVIRPDASAWDGRYNNNGWLQELPRPLSRLTWDNVVQLSPATAEQLGVRNGEIIELGANGRKTRGPVWIVPGQSDDTALVTLGYGRKRTGKVGTGVGFDVYPLRTSEALWVSPGPTLSKRGASMLMASVQEHHSMEGRGLIQIASASEYSAHPTFAQAAHHGGGEHGEHQPGVGGPFVGKVGKPQTAEEAPLGFQKGRTQGVNYSEEANPMSFYPEYDYTGHAWGMAIDLNACVGCNACMVACQSENNIAVVGKEQVSKGREMHWIRIDRYFEGDLDDPETVHQPVNCMQCENAPCEPVCPVGATVHSSEGTNDMVYNRCVGTRYCSNNCPYKVRRFNFLLYSDFESDSLKLGRNPDVTVRSRGVMEKCTYCTQRISQARIVAAREQRKIGDGEIVTACQEVCPAGAIVFGDINDDSSRVTQWKKSERNYSLLAELNTQPRTTYLARVRNPNPEMPQTSSAGSEGHAAEA
ncbi:MAG: 4Fe-4S dicluster domain-containing protein [Acidobacteria bacterium]|nr:4Fe-4S dicluster domain-containing protein [Acidobacteriota bacterium]